MSRIKPHGPVSPHFMNHHYGAAKPAPVSNDTALLRQALEAMKKASGFMRDSDYVKLNQTIAALRERLVGKK